MVCRMMRRCGGRWTTSDCIVMGVFNCYCVLLYMQAIYWELRYVHTATSNAPDIIPHTPVKQLYRVSYIQRLVVNSIDLPIHQKPSHISVPCHVYLHRSTSDAGIPEGRNTPSKYDTAAYATKPGSRISKADIGQPRSLLHLSYRSL